jgi:PAS domain-containing protein
MSQAVLMFDSETRLIFCNQRYIELYALSPEIVRPGCALRDLLRHRIERGSFSGDPMNIPRGSPTASPRAKPSATS